MSAGGANGGGAGSRVGTSSGVVGPGEEKRLGSSQGTQIVSARNRKGERVLFPTGASPPASSAGVRIGTGDAAAVGAGGAPGGPADPKRVVEPTSDDDELDDEFTTTRPGTQPVVGGGTDGLAASAGGEVKAGGAGGKSLSEFERIDHEIALRRRAERAGDGSLSAMDAPRLVAALAKGYVATCTDFGRAPHAGVLHVFQTLLSDK